MVSRKKGFSLIEVLVAVAVMTALLVPILLIFQFSTKATYRSTNDILATSLAMSKMEELKSLPYYKLENILLGLHVEDSTRDPNALITGPFERSPEMPDIAEPSFYSARGVTFHRYTYLSYFPYGNPNPNNPDFLKMRKRIRIKTQIFWKDRLSNTVAVNQQLSFEAIVHDENYNPKPLLNKFFNNGGN
jgi:prepilin-type N-terminal cleavage/methylation domain-containing protein